MNDAVETKAPKFCSKSYEDDGLAIFAFGDGEKLTANVSEFSEEIKFELMMHGMMQKVGDSYASAKGNYEAAKKAARAVIDQLANGQWTASRATGEAKPKTGELVEALAAIKGIDVSTVAAAVEKASDEQKKVWRRHPAVAAKIAELRAERALAKAKKALGDDAASIDL